MIYDDKQFIGKIIKKARKNAKLSQAQLCEKVDMSDKNLGNIENGKQFPMLNNFFRLMEVLKLSLEDFGVNTETSLNIKNSKTKLLKYILYSNEKEAEIYLTLIEYLNEIKLSKR